jgi:23S rRNA (uracil1939-C5)-methyltransferase
MEININKGQDLTVTVEGLAFGGKGFARINNFIIFIERALPQQQVRVRVIKKRQKYAEAYVLEIIEESPQAVVPPCPHFGLHRCGGCVWQNLAYEQQLKYKQQQVAECLQHIGGFQDFQVAEIVAADPIFFYRNKMEYSFGDRPWFPERTEIPADRPEFVLGLHVPGRFDRILEITDCQLLSVQTNEMLQFVSQFARTSGLKVWETKTYGGFWRHLVLREAKRTGQIMLNLVTSFDPQHDPVVDDLAAQLKVRFPQITTLVHSTTRRKSQVAISEAERILWGSGKITEQIGDFSFNISPNSFFQTNSLQARRLYDKIVEFAGLTGNEVVYDLYCGTGTISLYISKQVKQVYGFELVPAAIHDARENQALNQITNCEFVEGDLKDLLQQNAQSSAPLPAPDVLITDPPRAGMHPQVISEILALRPPRIVHVSCNPATLARDLKLLCDAGYQLEAVQPVDMFPHTAHCEAVARLKLK